MTAEQFAYWLQGFGELNSEAPTAEQWQSIKEHLSMVFVKVTPPLQSIRPNGPLSPNSARPWNPLVDDYSQVRTTC